MKKWLIGGLIALAFIAGYLYSETNRSEQLASVQVENRQIREAYQGAYDTNINLVKNLKVLCGVLRSGYNCPPQLMKDLEGFEDRAVFIPSSTLNQIQ